MKKFRPIDLPQRVAVRQRRLQGTLPAYNWTHSNDWYPASWQVNHRCIGDQFARLHYLACHAPQPIRLRWWPRYKRRCRALFGTARMSVAYANAWSCHSWL